MSTIEGDKKTYRPTEEEMKKAEEMADEKDEKKDLSQSDEEARNDLIEKKYCKEAEQAIERLLGKLQGMDNEQFVDEWAEKTIHEYTEDIRSVLPKKQQDEEVTPEYVQSFLDALRHRHGKLEKSTKIEDFVEGRVERKRDASKGERQVYNILFGDKYFGPLSTLELQLENAIKGIEGKFEKREDLEFEGEKLSLNDILMDPGKFIEDPNTSAQILREIANNRDIANGLEGFSLSRYTSRISIAAHPNTPVDVLVKIAESPKCRLPDRMMLALNPNTPVEVLQSLAEKHGDELLHIIEQNPNISDDFLIDLMKKRRQKYGFNLVEFIKDNNSGFFDQKEHNGGFRAYEFREIIENLYKK